MAYTPDEYKNLLKEIADSGGDTPKMLDLLQKLRDDYDEREGMLRKYQESKDKDKPEGEEPEREKIRRESAEDNEEDGGERRDAYRGPLKRDRERGDKRIDRDMVSRADYEDLRRKYIERFFTSPSEAKHDQYEDIRKDDDVYDLDFDDLFDDREG